MPESKVESQAPRQTRYDVHVRIRSSDCVLKTRAAINSKHDHFNRYARDTCLFLSKVSETPNRYMMSYIIMARP